MQKTVSGGQDVRPTPPKTWLVESILITIFCCLPFGIVGIVNASRVESRFYAGDVEAAERASADARKWTLWGLGVGVGVYVLYGVLMAMGVAASLFSL